MQLLQKTTEKLLVENVFMEIPHCKLYAPPPDIEKRGLHYNNEVTRTNFDKMTKCIYVISIFKI